MQTTEQNDKLTRRQIVALRGLRLPSLALKQLAKAGIYCQPAVSIEYQPLANRYVLLGKESGGAVSGIGAYCGYVSPTGQPLRWLSRNQSVGPNGIHATVLAPEFVRIHMFRNANSFDLLMTRHELMARAGAKRPALQNTILFHGAGGTIPMPLGPANAALPEFRSRGGQELTIPEIFREAASNAIAGARCIGCRSPHLLVAESEPAA